jgi:hypothetical protein
VRLAAEFRFSGVRGAPTRLYLCVMASFVFSVISSEMLSSRLCVVSILLAPSLVFSSVISCSSAFFL